MQKNKFGAFSALALMILCVVIYFLATRDNDNNNTPKPTTDPATPFDAAQICKQFVRDRLKAPATADFQNGFDAQSSEIQPDLFVVVSYVDSENSFGANIRTAYQCKVRYTGGDNWQLVDLITEP